MERRHRRQLEIIAFMGVYAVVYLAAIGPAIGGALPGFDEPALSGSDSTHGPDLPDTARGWLMIVLGVPALLGYMFLRSRLAGRTMRGYWEPGGES